MNYSKICLIRYSLILIFFMVLALVAQGADVHGEIHDTPATHSTTKYRNETGYNNTEHDEEEEDHEEEEHHEEEHHAGHAVVWPSAIGMMVFVTIFGVLFYKVYSRHQMNEYMKGNQSNDFFSQAIFSSAVTGIAAPSSVGFEKEKRKTAAKRKTLKFFSFKKSTKKAKSPELQGSDNLAVATNPQE